MFWKIVSSTGNKIYDQSNDRFLFFFASFFVNFFTNLLSKKKGNWLGTIVKLATDSDQVCCLFSFFKIWLQIIDYCFSISILSSYWLLRICNRFFIFVVFIDVYWLFAWTTSQFFRHVSITQTSFFQTGFWNYFLFCFFVTRRIITKQSI